MKKYQREEGIIHKLMADRWLSAMMAAGGYLAGGSVRALFARETVNDWDIFFPDATAFKKFTDSLDGEDSPSFTTTDTAWTHKASDGQMYQLIKAVYGPPEQVIEGFDFTCCMAAWHPVTGFAFSEFFMQHVAQYPICSLWRAVKFIKRGWQLPAIEAIKLALTINNLNLKDRGELKRQLLGIDTLFLKELTDALEKDKALAYEVVGYIEKRFPGQGLPGVRCPNEKTSQEAQTA